MKQEKRKWLKILAAVFLALAVVVSYRLYRSADRTLQATTKLEENQFDAGAAEEAVEEGATLAVKKKSKKKSTKASKSEASAKSKKSKKSKETAAEETKKSKKSKETAAEETKKSKKSKETTEAEETKKSKKSKETAEAEETKKSKKSKETTEAEPEIYLMEEEAEPEIIDDGDAEVEAVMAEAETEAAEAETEAAEAETEAVEEDTEAAEAENEAAEEEPEEEEKEIPRPAQELQAKAPDGTRVIVSAPEGALPEGAWIKAEVGSSRKAEEAIRDSLDEDRELVDLVVYDITVYDADGKEIDPAGPVEIRILGAEMEKGDEASLFQLSADGSAEKISDSIKPEEVTIEADTF